MFYHRIKFDKDLYYAAIIRYFQQHKITVLLSLWIIDYYYLSRLILSNVLEKYRVYSHINRFIYLFFLLLIFHCFSLGATIMQVNLLQNNAHSVLKHHWYKKHIIIKLVSYQMFRGYVPFLKYHFSFCSNIFICIKLKKKKLCENFDKKFLE